MSSNETALQNIFYSEEIKIQDLISAMLPAL
jgi:hypothetical protein